MNNTELLSQFNDDITTSNTLPYCQIQNPPNLSLSQIQQLNADWGWFIPYDQAELAQHGSGICSLAESISSRQFSATDNFVPTRLTFGDENPRQVDGFLTKQVRIVILHRSSIEVQERTHNGWRYLGQAYKNGSLTKFGEMAASDSENYRRRTRYLILFLDNDNLPLHSIPFRLGMNGGVAASFGEEVKLFRREVEETFFKLRRQPLQALTNKAHALTILDIELGIHKSDGKAPFIFPSVRLEPSLLEPGTSTVVERRGRKLTLISTSLQELIVPKISEAGKLILSLWEEHQGFSSQFQDDLALLSDDLSAESEVDF